MFKFANIKNYKNYYFGLIILFFVLLFLDCKNVLAGPIKDIYPGLEQEAAFLKTSGFDTNITLGGVVALVIQAFLGLLGIIFVVLIVIAGNKWMNARGNEEKVEEAQETIRRAIIGLIITVSAYAITYFVFSNLPG
jgi:hypothetical protein